MSILNPREYLCHRAPGPVPMDGKLDHDVWKAAPWTDLFVDIEGSKQPMPRHATRVKMLWDDENWYIGADLEEPHLWATLTEHDSIMFLDNDFEVFIDPDGDNHLYYELELNALNTTWDLLLNKPYKDGGVPISNWEMMGVKTAVHLRGTLNDPSDQDDGWSLVIAMPWMAIMESQERPDSRGIRNPWCPSEGMTWRVNFSRVEWDLEIVDGQYRKIDGRPEHNWVWSPQEVIDMHRPEHWGYVQFTHEAMGSGAFVQDQSKVARDTLHRIYYAQKERRKTHGSYAHSLVDLGLENLEAAMWAMPNGFEAHCQGLGINEESRIFSIQ